MKFNTTAKIILDLPDCLFYGFHGSLSWRYLLAIEEILMATLRPSLIYTLFKVFMYSVNLSCARFKKSISTWLNSSLAI